MTAVRRLLIVCVSLWPAACSAPPAAAPHTPVEDSSGTWRGTATRFQALSRSCPHPGLIALIVWDNRFQYRWDSATYVDAAIAADGSIAGQAPGITLVGKYAERRIEGDITNGDCGLHFTAVKKDN